jgi:hypothetical protein
VYPKTLRAFPSLLPTCVDFVVGVGFVVGVDFVVGVGFVVGVD